MNLRRVAIALVVLALAIVATHVPAPRASATEQFANTSATTLNGAITSGATSLVVTSAASFPTTGTFRIRIDSEFLLVTAVSGTTFTVTRGAESTSAAAHASGASVYGVLTAGALAGLQSDTLSSAALSASGLYVPLAGNPAALRSVALDPSVSGAYASQGVIRSYFSQGWFSRNSANTGETEVIGTNGGNSILIGSGSGTGASPSVFLLATTNVQVQPGGTTRLVVDTSGVALNATAGSFGGGAQVVFVGNRTTAPTSNPSGGGILWAESGELVWRGSGGNITSVTGLHYGTYANRPSAPQQGYAYTASDGHTPWVSDGSAWHPLIGGSIVGTAPPAAASFTAVNQGTSALTDSNGALKLVGVNDGATPQMHHYCVSATTAADAEISAQPPGSTAGSTFSVGCVELRESSSSKFGTMCQTVLHSTQIVDLEVQTWTASTTRATSTSYAAPNDGNGPIFVKVAISGSNALFQYSRNRIDWTTVNTIATTSVFTTAPNQACVGVMGFNIAPVVYIRHFASQ